MGHALGNNFGKFYSFQSKPVLADCQFFVDSTNAAGVTGVKGQGINAVYMHTSTTPVAGNPNPASGYALIQLKYNYTRVYGGPWNARCPLTGSNLAINGSALTAGIPYQITDAGHGEAGTCTIAPVADVSGSLASTWFRLYDNYGNTFIIWFSVSGVGAAPVGVTGTLVQQSITTGDSAATIGTALAVTINALAAQTILNPSAPAGVFSFTASGTTTVTLVSTQHNPYQPLPGVPADGTVPTGFTFALTKYKSNLQDWQAVGLPAGIQPVAGVSFIATATGYSTGGGSSGLVKAFGTTNIVGMEILGDPSLSIGPVPMGGSPNVGGWILVQFTAPTFAGSALGNHTHTLNLKNGAVSDGATTRVNAGSNLLGANTGSDLTIAGNGANGGIANASAGTPAGSVTYGPGAPADGTKIYMQFLLEQGTRVGGNNE